MTETAMAAQEQIGSVVDDVFRTMLGMEAASDENSQTPDQPVVTAAIFFAGKWKGGLAVEMLQPLAFALTQRLMTTALPSKLDDDVRDAMGELANMIGGNLKAMLPSGIELSMPSVVEGTDYTVRMCKANHSDRHGFRSECGPFWVTLFELN